MEQHLELREEIRRAIKNCLDCHDICLQTATYCMQQRDEPKGAPGMVRMLQDCAEICQTAANFMLRGSDMHGWVNRVVAEVCLHTAKECRRFEEDDMLHACEILCQRCAVSSTQVESLLAMI